MMTCKHCQKHLIAYIHRELPSKVYRRVGQHIDHCEACYAVYIEHKRLTSELRRIVPAIGVGRPPKYERVWTAMRLDSARGATNHYSLRDGMAMLAVTILLLVPFALGRNNQVFAGPPTQPSPLIRITPYVTAATEDSVSVAYEMSQTPAPARLPLTLPVDAISTP